MDIASGRDYQPHQSQLQAILCLGRLKLPHTRARYWLPHAYAHARMHSKLHAWLQLLRSNCNRHEYCTHNTCT